MAVSLSKLDLSFLKKADPNAIQRGRYRYDAEEGVIPAQLHAWKHRRPDRRSTEVAQPYYAPDVDAAYGGAWRSIIDGSVISSRTNWKEHNKRNGVLEVGPGYWGETKERDLCDITAEKSGYDPSLIGASDFNWVEPKV